VHTTHTKRIKLCSEWEQLARVVDAHGDRFNHINISAALVQLAKLGRAPQRPEPAAGSAATCDAGAWSAFAAYEGLLQQLLQMAAGSAPCMGARQAANCLWAAAKLSAAYPGGHPLCVALAQQLMELQAAYLLPWCNAQELSMR
jgi:hypothetical protein